MNLNLMKRIANKSDHKYKHCSLIYAGSRLLSYGYNTNFKHSEIVAINRLDAVFRNNKNRPTNLHMINLMIRKSSNTLGKSAPCINCLYAIKVAGIKRLTWFNSEGKPVTGAL